MQKRCAPARMALRHAKRGALATVLLSACAAVIAVPIEKVATPEDSRVVRFATDRSCHKLVVVDGTGEA